MAKVTAPNQQYNGLSAGVMFVNGIGETDDPHLLEWFENKGYRVEKDPDSEPDNQPGASSTPDPQDSENLSGKVETDLVDSTKVDDKPAEKPTKGAKAGK